MEGINWNFVTNIGAWPQAIKKCRLSHTLRRESDSAWKSPREEAMISTKYVWFCSALVASTVMMPAIFAQHAAEEPKPAVARSHFIVSASEVKWLNPPAGMARGTPCVVAGSPLLYALIEGDPLMPGVPFTIRLGCDDGYIAAPHGMRQTRTSWC
jgi:hypothetical protein